MRNWRALISVQRQWPATSPGGLSRQVFSFVIAAVIGYLTVVQVNGNAQSGTLQSGVFLSSASASLQATQQEIIVVPDTPTATPTATSTPEPPTATPTATAAILIEEEVEPPTSTPEPPTATPEPPTPTVEPPTPTAEPTATPEPAQGGPYPRGAVGYDISFPQCPSNFPPGAAYGIIGVTGGRAYTANPCFAGQFAWAESLAAQAAFYTNTSNSGSVNDHWGLPGPKACLDPKANGDLGCAYNFGWNGAAYAFALALEVTPAAASYAWWLDVETENSWNGTQEANAAAVQGFYDYFKAQGVAVVGVYSTGYQWNLITGGLQLPGAPNWVAGATSTEHLLSFCGASFSGGPVWLVQFQISPFHGNYACPL